MARTFSSTVVEALYSQTTGEVGLVSLEFTHPDLTTLRLVNNVANVTRNGNVYYGFPFSIILAGEDGEQAPRMQLSVSSVDRQVIRAIRQVDGNVRIAVTVEIFLASDPDNALVSYQDFSLTNVSYNASTLTADLIVEDYIQEAFPAQSFSPSLFPGLF